MGASPLLEPRLVLLIQLDEPVRPEVTLPLGVTVPVIAWGLGLDRMAMVAMEIKDIRDLFSRDLDFVRTKKISLNA